MFYKFKSFRIILILIFLAIVALVSLFLLRGQEDVWLCQNGQWVQHGRPALPKPQNGCGQEVLQSGNIRNLNINSNQEISSPLKITGEARGWYFEGSFPVMLTDWDGRIIAQGVAIAKGEWMTTEFVPFEASLEFNKPEYKNNGFLILKKDNPSGLPQNDAAYEIPVKYK